VSSVAKLTASLYFHPACWGVLDRGTSVAAMGQFQSMLDFPPAPKLNVYGKLDPAKATEQELAGQELFSARLNAPNAIRRLTTWTT
jgi:hypothetical protein